MNAMWTEQRELGEAIQSYHARGLTRGNPLALAFTRQGLLIVNFVAGKSAEFNLARRAADRVRGRVVETIADRERDVISRDDTDSRFE